MVHGKNTKVYFDKYNLTSYFDNAKLDVNADTAETSTFGTGSKKYIPGLKDATIALEGFFDGAAGAVDAVLFAALGTEKNMSVYPDSDTIGKSGYAVVANQTAHGVSSTIDGACRVSMAAQSNVAAERVLSLHALAAETANWTGTGVDGAAASANGGSAYIHVTAVTGTIEVKIQHATASDFSDAADLVAFTNVTAAVSERKTFAGTVNRYVRGLATIAGGETITFNIGFNRL